MSTIHEDAIAIRRRKAATAKQVADVFNVGALFRTIGCTRVYRVVQTKMLLGFVPAVIGVSLCGNFKTDARVADVLAVQRTSQ